MISECTNVGKKAIAGLATIHPELGFFFGVGLSRPWKRKRSHIGRSLKPKRSRNWNIDGVLRKSPGDCVGCGLCLFFGDEWKNAFGAPGARDIEAVRVSIFDKHFTPKPLHGLY